MVSWEHVVGKGKDSYIEGAASDVPPSDVPPSNDPTSDIPSSPPPTPQPQGASLIEGG